MVQPAAFDTATESVAVTAIAGGASANVLYTVPNFHDATVEFLHVSNGASSTDNISIQWYHKEDNVYYTIVNNKSISGNDVYNMITSDRLHLHAGDKITAFNGGGSTLGVTVSCKEYYNPARRA
jgi:hypothetical protein